MSTENKNKFNEDHMDDLLREKLLQDDLGADNKLYDQLSASVFSKETVSSIDAVREKELFNKLNSALGNKKKFNLWWLNILFLPVIGFGVYWFSSLEKIEVKKDLVNNVASSHNTNADPVENTNAESENAVASNQNNTPIVVNTNPGSNNTQVKPIVNTVQPALVDNDVTNEPVTIVPSQETDTSSGTGVMLNETEIPVLTAYEIERNNKQKNKMLKLLAKMDKEVYANIPAGKMHYKGAEHPVKTFGIRTAEVTNLEYKTFLIDLLIQKRTDDYKKARVAGKGWDKIGLEDHAYEYNTDEKYNDHPVVNISVQAAKMYCEWFSYQFSKYCVGNRSNILLKSMRLPSEAEWAYAAKAGNDSARYCNGLARIYNAHGCKYANFRQLHPVAIQWASKNNLSIDTAQFVPGRFKYCVDEKEYPVLFETDKYLIDYTVNVYSFNPNKYGAYCMAGNVSEMVEPASGKNFLAMGGNWNSFLENMLVEKKNNEQVNEPSPFVGFRPVIIFEYLKVSGKEGTPFW